MEETKHKNDVTHLDIYWLFFLPLSLILASMVNFPLRIDIRESFYDAVFYGTISLVCFAVAIRVYRRFGRRGYRLIAVILLCSVLSGWQIFDLIILRTGNPSVYGFGPVMSPQFTDHDGLAWYGLSFPNDHIMCHSLYERYVGTYLIAITVEIERDASWFACGG